MSLFLKSKKVLIFILAVSGLSFMSLKPGSGDTEIHWMNFDQAIKLNQSHPKKIFIDVYTSWCGWCKRMDATTYKDPDIINYINKNFYAVRLDAETSDTFHFNNHAFVNAAPNQRGSVNELAYSLLDGKLGYPTTVYMDEKVNRLTYVSSYLSAADLKPILMYFGENKYKTLTYDAYKKSLTDNKGTK